jgi:DNA-binding ferritin-like protein
MDMDNAWEKIKKSVREGAALSIEKIEEYSKIGKLKVEEFATKKKIERNYVDIGERVFELFETDKKADIAGDSTIKKAISNIKSLKEELVSIDKKIKTIVEEAKKSKKKTEDTDDISGI